MNNHRCPDGDTINQKMYAECKRLGEENEALKRKLEH